MEETKKSKKTILIVILVLIVVAAIIIGVISFGKNNNNEEPNDDVTSSQIGSTESEFETLKIKDLKLTFKEDDPETESNESETVLDFSIENTADKIVEDQNIGINIMDKNGGLIAGLETYVETIEAKGAHPVNIILAGKIDTIETLKLVKPAVQQEETAEEE